MKKIFLLLILFLANVLFAQGEANNWYFGEHAGLSFNSGVATPLYDGQLNTNEGCATISSPTGQLLFYTDGSTVYDRNHQIMPNGTGLFGHTSSTQSSIIVPNPSNPNIYYIFTTSEMQLNFGVRYSEVDLTLNGGFGDITVNKNIILLNGEVSEKLTSVKQTNGQDYWVVCHDYANTNFHAFSVTSSGVSSTSVVSSIGSPFDVDAMKYGYLKFSPDGSLLANTVSRFSTRAIELFDFDTATGILSNLRSINCDNMPYGVEFSASGNILYVTTQLYINFNSGVYKLLQYDLTATNIEASKQVLYDIAEHGTFYTIGALQMAPDGMIYMTIWKNYAPQNTYISRIESPEVLGTGCNFNLNAIDLSPGYCRGGLPQFIQSYFIAGIQAQNFCLGDVTSFSVTSNDTIVSVNWDFGDGFTSTDLNPTHTYSSPGIYTVTAQVTNSTETIIKTKEITIYQTPLATQPSNISECDNDNNGYYSFDLTQNEGAVLNGQSSTDFGVNYYANMVDYTNKVKITTPTGYNNTSLAYQPQTIVAEVYNKDNSSCTTITSFDIQVFESPIPATSILPIEKCDNTTFGTDTDGRIVFDLTERENDILNGQSLSTFTIEYYTDSALTNLIGTPNNYVNTNSNETIYVKVYNTQNTSCLATTSFNIEVFSLPIVNNPVVLKQCDDDNDGYSAFNLTEAIALISTDASLSFSFFETVALANSGTSPITNLTAYTNQTVSNDAIYVRVENANGCYRVVTLNLVVSTTLISSAIQEHFYMCDDTASGSNTDGIATFDFSSVDALITSQYPVGQLLTITYYRNLADALAEQNAIVDISNFTNSSSPNIQNIYVRVDSQLNNECLGLGHHITLHVEAIPIVQPLQYTHCDDDQDGSFAFDTTNLESDLLNGLTNVTVSYFDAVGNPVTMTNPFNTISQTLTVRVTNNTSTACYYETTLTFIVDDLPEAFSIPNNLIKFCDDETVPNLQDGMFAFDTSNFQNIILGIQTGMIVNYYDENGNSLPSPLPNPFVTVTQDVLVEVINPINNNCFATNTIAFEVYPLPYIDLYGTELICSNDPSFVRIINAGLEDETLQNNYTYNWYFNGSLIAGENNYELTVNTDGIYTVDVISSDGCVMTRTIQVTASNIATIQNIEIVELSDNNSIIIEVTGSGDFEYSLDNNSYQDSNTFYSVEPGIYTVYIRDKYGCGVVNEDVSILGIPNFFTPNGDGYNDTWNIKGANVTFNSKTIIYIFDRYGKLLKQISPLGKGWDGTYNGELMPSSDYWYSIELENGKIVKGHFSLKR